MKAQSVISPTVEKNLLFDDRSVLEQAFGKAAFKVSQINPNCDCSAYYSHDNVEPDHTDEITASVAPAS